MKTTEKILVVDLEATCWEQDGKYQRDRSEIIEIGICELETYSGKISKKQGILVKPENSEISPFCTKLTSITPAMVEKEGVSFAEAIDILFEDYDAPEYTWASYGNYDRSKMQAQCRNYQEEYPFSEDHLNVKEVFREASQMRRSIGMKRALQHLRMPMEGTHHRGIDDAFNTAKILYWCLK